MEAIMKNRTNKEISSRNKRMRILRYVLLVFNILLLIAAVTIAAMVLTGCSKEPESYPEAEAIVAEELDALKSSNAEALVPDAINDASDQFDPSMLEGYVEKMKEFEYEILGSSKADNGNEGDVAVKVKITTYDFANEYLKAWEEFMTVDDENRWQSQFYGHLFLRLASVSSKDYTADVDVICTQDADGKWTTNLKENKDLMNALSGGMMAEMEKLMTDDVVMDETEVNN